VDDALALLLAMRSPEIEDEAITPVAGNVPLELDVTNALRWWKSAGRTTFPSPQAPGHSGTPLGDRHYAHGEKRIGRRGLPRTTTKPVAELRQNTFAGSFANIRTKLR